MLVTAAVLVVLLSLLVFVHELGHFASAKLLGIKVEEFGFGFPPRLAGFRRGDTDYTVNWIPLGGFVRIKGESGEVTGEWDSFASRPAWQKLIVLCAGVTMNFLLAWALLTVGYVIGLPQITDDALPAHARITDSQLQAYSILEDSPAAEVGVQPGDLIVAADGQPVADVESFRSYAAGHVGQAVRLDLSRDGQPVVATITPRELAGAGRVGFGIAIVRTGLVSYPLWLAPWRALQDTAHLVGQIFDAFRALFTDLLRRQPVSVEFSGPVGIAVITADVVSLGFRHLLQFAALLSINLAVVNILPLPALDGGRAAFVLAARVGRRRQGILWENVAHQVGFALLLLLVAFVTVQDAIKFGSRLWHSVGF